MTAASALTVSLYAPAHAILAGFISLHATQRSFENGPRWSAWPCAGGSGLLVLGLRRRSTDARTGGMILLGLPWRSSSSTTWWS